MSNYIIKYNNVEFPVNPEIFAEKSETFKHYYNPDQTMTITGERSVDRFKKLLPYVQGEEPNITTDNIDEIESFADEWEVQSLRDSIENWKKLHEVDIKLDEFLESSRARIPVSSLIPGMVENINELFNKPKFLNVPPKLLHQILSSATKQEKIKNHNALYNFIMNFINKDQQNRLNLLNFINPNYLSQNEIEQFFESDLIPDDPYLLSQIPTFLTNLALLFREKYKNEQNKISSIEIEIQKKDSVLDKKNKEYQIVKNQLTELQQQEQQQQQQQQQQLSKKPKKPKNNPMVYHPDSDNERQPTNNSQKQDNRFSYTPPSNSDSTPSAPSYTTYNNSQDRGGYRGGRGSRGGKGRGGSRNSSHQTSEPSNPNMGVVTMSNEVPAAFQMQPPIQMPMQMPMGAQMPMNMQMPMQMPMVPQMLMNVPLMSDTQIKELEEMQTKIQQQMQQLVSQNPLNSMQINELNNLTQRYQQIQIQLEQQKQKKNSMQSNHSISIQKNTKDSQISVQTPNIISPLGSPLNQPTSSPPPSSSPSSNPIQVERLVPNISIEKPKIKRTTLDPEQKAKIAAAKKQASVKVERPVRGASIEFGKTNDDQT